MGKFLIGWAEESLVPDKKVSLSGQFFERISEYVESEITATVEPAATTAAETSATSIFFCSFCSSEREHRK